MNILLGLAGLPRSGKDTVGAILEDEYGFRRYAFGDYLKNILNEFFGCPAEDLWGPKTKETRKLLHSLGDFVRSEDPNKITQVVISNILQHYESNKEAPFRVVITDVRSEQEAKVISNRGAAFLLAQPIAKDFGITLSSIFRKSSVVLVGRKKSEIIKQEEGLEEALEHHIEQLPNQSNCWDYYLDNNGTIQELRLGIKTMMSTLEG